MAGINSYSYYTKTNQVQTSTSDASCSSGASAASISEPTATSDAATRRNITYTANSPNTAGASSTMNASGAVNASSASEASIYTPTPQVMHTSNVPTQTGRIIDKIPYDKMTKDRWGNEIYWKNDKPYEDYYCTIAYTGEVPTDETNALGISGALSASGASGATSASSASCASLSIPDFTATENPMILDMIIYSLQDRLDPYLSNGMSLQEIVNSKSIQFDDILKDCTKDAIKYYGIKDAAKDFAKDSTKDILEWIRSSFSTSNSNSSISNNSLNTNNNISNSTNGSWKFSFNLRKGASIGYSNSFYKLNISSNIEDIALSLGIDQFSAKCILEDYNSLITQLGYSNNSISAWLNGRFDFQGEFNINLNLNYQGNQIGATLDKRSGIVTFTKTF